jgi:hypothetical protein
MARLTTPATVTRLQADHPPWSPAVTKGGYWVALCNHPRSATPQPWLYVGRHPPLTSATVRHWIMADDGATRTRRWKAHKQGLHHLCGPRCDARSASVTARVPGDMPEGPVDVDAALERQARRLEAACEAGGGNAVLERELRLTLLALRGPGESVDRELAEFDAAFSAA